MRRDRPQSYAIADALSVHELQTNTEKLKKKTDGPVPVAGTRQASWNRRGDRA